METYFFIIYNKESVYKLNRFNLFARQTINTNLLSFGKIHDTREGNLMSKTESKPYGTVLLKADQILNFLYESTQPQRLSVIAKATDLTNSTASKILNTLVLIGYVKRDSKTNEFDLGPSIIKYAKQSLKQLDIKKVAQPHLEKLQEITTETVHLGMIENDQIVYLTENRKQ